MKSPFLSRLLLILFVVALLLVVTSPITAVVLIRMQAKQIVQQDLRALTSSSLASMNVSEGFKQTASAVMDNDPSLLPEVLKRLDETTHEVDIQYDTHRQTLKTPEERQQFEHLLACRRDYRETRGNIFRLLKEGKLEDARSLFDNECKSRYERYLHALEAVVQNNVSDARNSGAKIIRLCNWLIVIQAALLVFFFIYGFFVPLTAFLERLTRKQVML